ncbi:MAG: hypothetical protein KDC90_08490 [Ignavibacteriae bacterium]|nr:hypothetical protein [Ignavibacteriota bacterium]
MKYGIKPYMKLFKTYSEYALLFDEPRCKSVCPVDNVFIISRNNMIEVGELKNLRGTK